MGCFGGGSYSPDYDLRVVHLLNRGTEYEDLASITLISDASSKQSAEQ